MLLYCPLLSEKSPKGDVLLSSCERLGIIFIKATISLRLQESSLVVPLALCLHHLWTLMVIASSMTNPSSLPRMYWQYSPGRSLSFIVSPPSSSPPTLHNLFPKTSSSFSRALSETLSINKKHNRFWKMVEKTSDDAYGQGPHHPGSKGETHLCGLSASSPLEFLSISKLAN